MSDTNLDRLMSIANCELFLIANWFAANKLSLHLSETKSIIFCNFRKLCAKTQVKIKPNDDVIEQVCSVKFLGVNIEEWLSWYKHPVEFKK